MALNIKDPEADRLARELAGATGESLTTAVTVALSERLQRVTGALGADDLVTQLTEIAARCSALPVLDDRPDDEIMGYDDDGAPA